MPWNKYYEVMSREVAIGEGENVLAEFEFWLHKDSDLIEEFLKVKAEYQTRDIPRYLVGESLEIVAPDSDEEAMREGFRDIKVEKTTRSDPDWVGLKVYVYFEFEMPDHPRLAPSREFMENLGLKEEHHGWFLNQLESRPNGPAGGYDEPPEGVELGECPVDGCEKEVEDVYTHCLQEHGFWQESFR